MDLFNGLSERDCGERRGMILLSDRLLQKLGWQVKKTWRRVNGTEKEDESS